MKKFGVFFTSLACLMVVMCKKDSAVSIVNNWSLVNDSVYSTVGIAGYHSNYRGMNSDYFYFSPDGKLFTKEGASFDTSGYRLISGNKIIIDSFSLSNNGEYLPGDISGLTTNNATITISSNGIQMPGGGTYKRIINLRR